ncbi:hypothetical protein BDN72DRAFT_836845 [Pluteus cervinus]|uniref:Uncharacterized protein n=1 Tax=Pluteus cervinus TaxID=181527 RepID=A0ACD3B519_9AGAR|nr:hypothetical protein BDN72DRAFT_836845 [Pluteus cervinus]
MDPQAWLVLLIKADVRSSFMGRPVTPDSLETPSHSSSGIGRATNVSTPPSFSSAPYPHSRTRHDDLDDSNDDEDEDNNSFSNHTKGLYMRRPPSERRLSVSSSTLEEFPFHTGSPPHNRSGFEHDPKKIILRPSLSNATHQLSTLSHSNHTLSPYTRSLEHFTVRSVPPRGGVAGGVTRSSVIANSYLVVVLLVLLKQNRNDLTG